MKKHLIILLLIVVSDNLSAQNDSTSIIKNGVGITLSPMLSMPISRYNQSQFPGFSATAGISGNYAISKKHKMYINAELGYTNNSMIQKNIPTFLLLTPAGSVPYSRTTYFSINRRYNYAYLAISVQKVILKFSEKLFLFAGIGAQLNYNYSIAEKTNGMLDYNGNNIDRTFHSSGASVSQNFSVSAFAKVGIMANISKRLSCFAAPVFYYDLNPKVLFKHNDAEFNNIGINLQLIYAF
jgi:hypothetical protein